MAMRQLKITNSITSRESLSLEKYLQEISKIGMISPQEEVELVSQIKKGNKSALDRLTKANLRFVVSVAKQYQGQGLSLPDLINEGNLGLIKAAQSFDETRGFKFISFAVWWIRQNILYAISKHARMIRLPLHRVAMKNKIQKAQSTLEQQLERLPSEEELAEMLNMDIEEVVDTLDNQSKHVSLDVPFEDEEDGSLLDVIENPNAEKAEGELCHGDSLKAEVARSFRILNEKQKQTLCYFFGIGYDRALSLDEIAQKMDLTPERVRQIKDKALEKLRTVRNLNDLRGFLAA